MENHLTKKTVIAPNQQIYLQIPGCSKAFCAIHGVKETNLFLLEEIIEAKRNSERNVNEIVSILMSKQTLERLENECKDRGWFVEDKTLYKKCFVYGTEITIFDSLPFGRIVFCRKDGSKEIKDFI